MDRRSFLKFLPFGAIAAKAAKLDAKEVAAPKALTAIHPIDPIGFEAERTSFDGGDRIRYTISLRVPTTIKPPAIMDRIEIPPHSGDFPTAFFCTGYTMRRDYSEIHGEAWEYTIRAGRA